ncbi:MAG TPA: hypothetical protein DF296_07830 [Candidatus Margulisbacteria bacterium]|nr:MAG: hypothetical protein A2X42_12155 [Candidatus Margulisbacteria bacterium GWF2_38_17]OGI09544.1 MAG: hypothetical protein A2X41_06360 [Candidatus Margulisbacteria bacterium GWE2_39_32]HCT85097.1 hypothetical protein [Candidatus Margulisiibacteriota bacterium]
MTKFIITNNRSLQLQIKELNELNILFDEVIYISNMISLPAKIIVYSPLLVILVQESFDTHLIETINTIKADIRFPQCNIVLVTDKVIFPDIKHYITKTLPISYTSAQLVQTVLDVITHDVDQESDYAKEQKALAPKDAEKFNKAIIKVIEEREERLKLAQESTLTDKIENEKSELKTAFNNYEEELFAGISGAAEIKNIMDRYYNNKRNQDEDTPLQPQLIVQFWALYKQIAYQAINSASLSLQKRMFLRYGIIDIRLVSEQLIEYICESPYSNIYNEPVYYFDEWLPGIYKGKREISLVDEIKTRLTSKEYKNMKGDPALRHELDTLKFMAKISAGKRGLKLPILDSASIGNHKDVLCTRTKVATHIKKVDEIIDPTIFQRATLDGIKHVPPVVLITPGYGLHSMCWQICDKNDRDYGPARIVCPLVSHKSIEVSVIAGLASFRWEYAKFVMPSSWEKEGPIADYYRIYGNPRSDLLESYIRDYSIWVTKESENRTILSKDLRRYFWVKAPFGKDIVSKVKDNLSFRDLYLNRLKHHCLI